jgi:PilZ domain
MRQFVRHPVDIPVEIGAEGVLSPSFVQTNDISLGGLAVRSSFALSPGDPVVIRIPSVRPPFEARARVAWCLELDDLGYELGVTFLDVDDAFRARMVEQVFHIEDYRKSVYRLEGRELSLEEAANEWIGLHAAQFPEIAPSLIH